MMIIWRRDITIFLSIICLLIGLSLSVSAGLTKDVDLNVLETNFTSDLSYWGLKITDYVKNYAGELNIELINKGIMESPEATLSAEIKYIYSKPGSSPVIYPTGFEQGRLHLGKVDLPSIVPNKSISIKLKTETISLRKPGVDESVTLYIVIRDLSKDSNMLYEGTTDHILTKKSEAVDQQRSKLYFIISIITLIIVFITLLISLPEKRPVLSVVIIIALSIIAYLIYRSA